MEEIVDYERPTRYAYRMLSGLPTRDHVGTIELREAGAGTEISWHLRATVGIPGVDRLLLPAAKKVVEVLLTSGIAAAERRQPSLATSTTPAR